MRPPLPPWAAARRAAEPPKCSCCRGLRGVVLTVAEPYDVFYVCRICDFPYGNPGISNTPPEEGTHRDQQG